MTHSYKLNQGPSKHNNQRQRKTMQMRTENGRERGHVEGCRVSLDCELQLVNNRCVTDTNTIDMCRVYVGYIVVYDKCGRMFSIPSDCAQVGSDSE